MDNYTPVSPIYDAIITTVIIKVLKLIKNNSFTLEKVTEIQIISAYMVNWDYGDTPLHKQNAI